ncbi:hypothetical protein C2G38_2121211 [Gigaspora rosea]|uniref:Integral membrane protein n=1 Tax=Gigaspora rosea TaxID=44941 RepID=A0A397U4Z2_9GLOM|nr:hypothetical protein C2G38_2121211 [Gigaspora rosea]
MNNLDEYFDISVPPNYTSPNWYSLYWPFDSNAASYLYKESDIRWYTTIWTIIFFMIIYGFAGIFACIVFHKYRWSFLILVGFLFVALITGFVGGTIIGYVLAALYSSGDFPMSVWIPFIWGLIQAFLVLLRCFSTFTTIL